MITDELIIQLFSENLSRLAAENGLKKVAKEKIVQIFIQAINNPYMDERQIYQNLIRKEPE